MFDNLIQDALADAVARRSRECERCVIAISPEHQAGFALIAPDCIMFSQILCGGYIVDVVLN